MKVLVCGATGFIGRNLAERFAGHPGWEVVGVYHKRPAFDHPGLGWVEADLTDPRDIARCLEGVDVIIQAAATTSGSKDIVTRPYIHVTDNAVMNSLLFRAAFERQVKHVVFFSCTVMYPSSEEPLTEEAFDANAPLHPRYFGVANTKLYIEKMCEFFSRISQTRFTAIRHSNIYGPHDKFDLERSHVFGATITKVLTAREGRITVWGTGEEARDLLYVDDLADFVEAAIERQQSPFGLYNCGIGQAVSIKDLVHAIVQASGRALRIEHDLSQPTIKTSLSLDCSKAERELGWKAKTSLAEGIARTIQWWRAHPPVEQ
ncbi:MAG: NAD-dependent epimerase/dehydratase family protein [Magnetococcales bacterium]|nr:NAD-dependent epimerase/dehydratase family protein [Magnetococcales bacterium]